MGCEIWVYVAKRAHGNLWITRRDYPWHGAGSSHSSPAARAGRTWPRSLIRAQRHYRRLGSEIRELARTG